MFLKRFCNESTKQNTICLILVRHLSASIIKYCNKDFIYSYNSSTESRK
uniref:Uncharacterized protein n=1 Tax=Rhizophora mucronata TaxID=61149 RepID=A0A2P2QUJ1_RHIMU